VVRADKFKLLNEVEKLPEQLHAVVPVARAPRVDVEAVLPGLLVSPLTVPG